MDGAHASVLFLRGYPQRRVQAGAGGHQLVSGRLEQSHRPDASPGGAGGHGGHREDLPRGAQSADHSREPFAQYLLPGQRDAAAAHLQHGGAERARGLDQPGDQEGDDGHAAARRIDHAGACDPQQASPGAEEF
ncbi:hypothetical protein SDC9_205538 [bioreactor metagenome]|uniref:Uncharacterized protein n=1 Tax=bioreactor metagenome TaxID=1076179 RepID=A0A645J407_9ZZZZ